MSYLAWQAAAQDPHFVHLMILALMGETCDHLRQEHGIEPPVTPRPTTRDDPGLDWKKANLTAHWKAHRTTI